MRKSPWILVTCVIVGGLFGGLLGEILVAIFPHSGIIQNVFTQAVHPGLAPPVTVDLGISASAFSLAIALQNFTPTGSAQVYRMNGGAAPAAGTALAVTNGSISGVSLASNSAALLVLSK